MIYWMCWHPLLIKIIIHLLNTLRAAYAWMHTYLVHSSIHPCVLSLSVLCVCVYFFLFCWVTNIVRTILMVPMFTFCLFRLENLNPFVVVSMFHGIEALRLYFHLNERISLSFSLFFSEWKKISHEDFLLARWPLNEHWLIFFSRFQVLKCDKVAVRWKIWRRRGNRKRCSSNADEARNKRNYGPSRELTANNINRINRFNGWYLLIQY